MNIKTIVFFAVRLAECQSPALSVTGCWMTGTSALPKPRNPADTLLILNGTPLARTNCSSLLFGLCANVGADALAKSSSDSKNTPMAFAYCPHCHERRG